MKRIIFYLLLFSMMLSVVLTSCNNHNSTTNETPDNHCTVPDIYNISSETAEQIIVNSGLIPIVVTEENNDIAIGNVIKCSPEVGAIVEKNTRITIFVSSGKSEQFAKSYECVDVKDDGFFNFELQTLSIKDECLNICLEVEPLYDGGKYIKLDFLGSGIITFNDMKKEIPITYNYDKERITYKEKQNITISIPLESFDGEMIDRFRLTIDFNVNQPDWNFKPYDKTSTASTFWWKIEW